MNELLRYAPHTGYLPQDRTPLFSALASPDISHQVRFAASQGMGGILDPWAIDRSAVEIEALERALDETGLVAGCVCALPLARFTEPLWVAGSNDEQLRGYLSHSLRIAKRLRSSVLAVLLFADGDTAPAVQRRRAIDRLRGAADLASARGITIGVEPIKGISGPLIDNFADAVDLVRGVGHPGVKLIFDTGHVTDFGDRVLESYAQAYDDIAVLQLADMPGRVEAGGGRIDFVPVLAHAIARGYEGLVELEHQWSESGEDVQRRGLERLRAIDAQAQEMAAGSKAGRGRQPGLAVESR